VAFQNLPSPIGKGWSNAADGAVEIQWTSGSIMPQQLVDVLHGNSVEEEDEGECYEYVDEIEVDNIVDVVFSDEEEADM
jgi:hypothetical protein